MNGLIFLADASPSVSHLNWVVYLLWFGFFCLGFFVSLYFRKRWDHDASDLEEENRRLHAAYKKRERDYLDNRELVSSIIGKEFKNRK